MKDYDAIARELNLRMPCEVKGHENDCPHPHVQCSECCERRKIARDAAILRKHDEAEASGEQYNRPADILAHLKDYPGARDRLIDLLANECWPRSFVADCFAKYDEIQSRPAPADEKALRTACMSAYWSGAADGASRTASAAEAEGCVNELINLVREAPKDDEQEWLDENGYMPGNDDSLPKANEAPKDESKEGGA